MKTPPLDNAPADLLSGHAIPAQALQDMYLVADIEIDVCKQIADALHELDPSADPSLVPSTIVSKLDEESSTANSVLRIVTNLDSGEVDGLLTRLNRWIESKPERNELFSAEKRERLEANLRNLAGDFPIVSLNKKAQEIVRSVGNEFAIANCYCDLRPVFDDAREQVDAFVLLTTLKLTYVTQEAEKKVLELAMKEEDLIELRDEIGRALHKIEKLKPIGARLLEDTEATGEIK